MALGGGTWLTQNKVLPGTYVNFTSVAKASATLSNRGYAAAPFALSWGPEGEVFAVTSGDFQKNSKVIFGALSKLLVRWLPQSTPVCVAMI